MKMGFLFESSEIKNILGKNFINFKSIWNIAV